MGQLEISRRWGGRRYPPYAFTVFGIAMLSTVLQSERAVQVNIEIMRTFIRLRAFLADHQELRQRYGAASAGLANRMTGGQHESGRPLRPAPGATGHRMCGDSRARWICRATLGAPPMACDVVAVAAEGEHALAIVADGTALAWGDNTYGALGDGTQFHRGTAASVLGLTAVRSIATGARHSIAALDDGSVWTCWGATSGESWARRLRPSTR